MALAPLPRERGALLLLILAAGALCADPPKPVFVTGGDRTVIEVCGLELERYPPGGVEWQRVLAVFTWEASLEDGALPPVLGAYEVEPPCVRFTPRFPLARGVTYVARWRDPATPGAEIRESFEVPRPDLPPSTTLLGIYPSATDVPENLLRVYLQFSAPMSRGTARHHIRLVDGSGRPVEEPFVAPERELWSPDGTRLTLFFDPGRIKRGVGPNAEVGPPLSAGESYRLEVDHQLADGRGVPLVRDYFKTLRVTAPDRDQPRVDDWTLEPPSAPDDPVALGFPEPLDRGLLEGLLGVLDERGEPVAGIATVDPGEAGWSFRPERAWGAGVYRIRVGTLLEDLAGNSLRRAFEVALAGDGRIDAFETRYLDLPFSLP